MKLQWIGFFALSLVVTSLGLLLAQPSPANDLEPATLAEYMPTPEPGETCDLCEPNDTLSQACGPLISGEKYRFFALCKTTSEADDDLYYIELARPGRVCSDLTGIPPGVDLGLYLYDARDITAPICSSNRSGDKDEHVCCDLDRSGRYYVRVYPHKSCSNAAPYTLKVSYPTLTPTPPPSPTSAPTPPCNVHIDDFGDTDPVNDLGRPSGWELEPKGCGTFTPRYTGSEVRFDYDLSSSSPCTARYTTGLSLDAYPYPLLAVRIKGSDPEQLSITTIGLSDAQGHKKRVKVGDLANHLLADNWQGVLVPLTAFSATVKASQLDTLFVEFDDTLGSRQGTIYVDSLRLERPLAPLVVDNFDDLTDPNALGGASYTMTHPSAQLETAYISVDTYDRSPGSYAISYTLPAGEWAIWLTKLDGVDVSDYAFLSFYIKGANGGEMVNLYLVDGQGRRFYVDLEDYGGIRAAWSRVTVPLRAFKGVALEDVHEIQLVFEWDVMSSTILIDNLRFVSDRLQIDSFCDEDWNNSLNGDVGLFTSRPSCLATVDSEMVDGTLRLDYDVTAGADCFSGYWSRTLVDLNPYGSLTARVRGDRCGQAAALSARTVSTQTDKIKLDGYLPEGITYRWQEVRIPLAASSAVRNWAQGDSYVIAFEASQGASKGSTWWDDASYETARAPLWVDNFDDQDHLNALGQVSETFLYGSGEISSTLSITYGHGDAGAGLVLSYHVLEGYAGWQTWLPDVDLSQYDRLVFDIKNVAGGDKLHVYLVDGDPEPEFIEIKKYGDWQGGVSSQWQTLIIPLRSFGGLDLTRIKALQFVIEWAVPAEGTVFLDNIRFLSNQNLAFLPTVVQNSTPLILPARWDFETGTEGWTYYQGYTPSLAIVDVVSSSYRALSGYASLAATVRLVDGHNNLSKGVAYIDLEDHPPQGIDQLPCLTCQTISCWVYVPTCGVCDPTDPNYLRLFVKYDNKAGELELGPRTPVVPNRWFEVTMRPHVTAPVARLHLQFGTKDNPGCTYDGKIYVDACGWQETYPLTTDASACMSAEDEERVPVLLPPVHDN